jgi:glycosyltransferase involved in cell wall biosynthesis
VSSRKIRLAYLVTHPIQYQAPLLRLIAKQADIDLTVFFCSDISVKSYKDSGFGRIIEWDVPLLDGYKYEFLPALGKTDSISFWHPFNYGLAKRLKSGEFDALWIHGYARWFHWVAMISGKFLGIKVLIRDEATLISTQRSWLKKIAKRAFFSLLNRLCDGFLAIGTLNKEYYRHYGIERERIFSVPYTVDNDFFQENIANFSSNKETLRSSLGLKSNKPVILYASKMTERKRAIDLLEAYIRLSPDGSEPEAYLLFIGDGEMRASLEKRANELAWNSIRFLGFQNQTDLPKYYDLCDVFVLPSFHEPWGLVVNEVMNAGKAVIASDQVGSVPDLVKNDQNGYIFQAGNIDELSQSLRDVLRNKNFEKMGPTSLELVNNWSFREDVAGLKRALGI